MANKANYLHLLAIALLAAAPFCSLLSYVGAVGCDVTYHSSMIVAACSPGSNVSADCCGFVVATLAAGGANCLCLTCIRSQSTGFRTADCEGYYEACGGTGDYDAELRTCSAQDAGTPMLPSTPPPPPPPLQVQKVVEEIPWWHWVLEWLLSLMTFVAILVLLFFIVKFCKGRAGDIAAAALERMLCIAPNAAQPSSVERTVQDNNSSHSIDMSQHRFEEERTSAERNIHRGDEISLTANHFDVKTAYSDITFYHYAVCIKSMDEGKGVHCKHLRRRILSKLQQSYGCRLGYKHLVYDGDRSVFAVGPLPDETFEAIVCLEKTYSRSARKSEGNRFDVGRAQDREEYLTESFKVAINYLAKVSLAPAVLALEGSNSEYTLRVLDSVLRQQHAKRGYLLMKQSYFSNEAHNLVDLTGGVSACFGIHSCFRTTLDGLTLNMDVSTTIVVTPGPVLGFVLASQNLIDVNNIDWSKANEMLKELRVVDKHNDTEVRIIGLSGQPCSRQNFQTRISSGRTIEITVQEYFLSTKGIKLTMPSLPCLDVGKPNNPCYLPIELCHVVSLQRYTKALSSQQRAFFLEKSRQKPEDQIRVVKYARQQESYEDDPVLSSSGIKIEKQLTHISGCVLSAPKLIFGNSEVCIPNGGRWNYNSKMLLEPVKIEHWAIVNFSAHCDMSWLSKELINLGHSKGLSIDHPYALVIEFDKSRICSPVQRVEMMFKRIREKVKNPEFLLCVLPERKNCDIYGCWI